jgi:hypothetical protein
VEKDVLPAGLVECRPPQRKGLFMSFILRER